MNDPRSHRSSGPPPPPPGSSPGVAPPGDRPGPARDPRPAGERPLREGDRKTRFALVLGTVVVAVGLWLLLDAAGVPVPDLGRHWPAFLFLGGIASAVDWALVSGRPGSAGQAVVGIGFGVLFYLLELDRLAWRDVGDWWPALFLIAGLGYLTAWGTGRFHSTRKLTAGLVLLGIAITGWGWQVLEMQVVWAVILLAIGIFVLVRTLRRGE